VFVLWGGGIRATARVDLELDPDNAPAFAIYRLLQLSRLSVAPAGSPVDPVDIPYATSVETSADIATYQVRLIRPDWDAIRRVVPGRSLSLCFEYEGPICGAREALPYFHDHVSEKYTLLREEVLWFPILYRGDLTASWRGKSADAPTYAIRVTCPDTLTAVTGGTLAGAEPVPAPAGSDLPAASWRRYDWRADVSSFMGISCGDYHRHDSADGRVSLYCFPEDDGTAAAAMAVVERTMALCRRWLGPLAQGRLVVAEVPAGWGAQASPLLILQTADSLAAATSPEGQKRLYSQLGHEVAHLWSVLSLEAQSTRWLDEGMTHFMEALLLEDAFGPAAYRERMAAYRQRFMREYEHVAAVPLSECGAHLFQDAIARGKGPWVLAVLRELIGDERLAELMRVFTQAHLAGGAILADFVSAARSVTGRNLTRFFGDWFDGTASSEMLASDMTVSEMAERYRD
jgi:hypothetical protein